MHDFRQLEIWKAAIAFVDQVYETVDMLPKTERFGVADQMRRASVSIPCNIAEGCGRRTNRDFRRFLEFSLGSAYEVETLIEISRNRKWISDERCKELTGQVRVLQMRIARFMEFLARKQKPA